MTTVITLDGLSGVGKGTLATQLTIALQQAGFDTARLDSGAIFRAAALFLGQEGYDLSGDLNQSEQLAEICEKLTVFPLRFVDGNSVEKPVLQVFLGDKNITSELRLEATALLTSKIAQVQPIRDALLQRQRNFAQGTQLLIAEGRDMGEVIFPEAKLKFFVEADPVVKAQRRYAELTAAGNQVDYQQILTQMTERDALDRKRTRKLAESIVIDTSNLGIAEMTKQALAYCLAELKAN